MFMKLNLVRFDPQNGIVIGSYRQKTHERYLQRKERPKEERQANQIKE